MVGAAESAFLQALPESELRAHIDRLFTSELVAIIVANAETPPPYLLERCNANHIALFTSPQPSPHLVDVFRYYLARVLAESTTLHGVFLDVLELGVLITGASAIGKSELALELISRGHRLVADDAPEFTQIAPDVLDGTCPDLLQDLLEVRGLGVLNIRQMFGDTAVKKNKYLRLIVHLSKPHLEPKPTGIERLIGDNGARRVLDLDVPMISLPVMPGRNLAVLTEAATRTHILRAKGVDPAAAFMARHSHFLERADDTQ